MLPDLRAARVHAERINQEDAQAKRLHNDPSLIMQVKDEAHRTVLFLPLIPSD